MKTIIGYLNHSYPHLLRANALPSLRLHFFRSAATITGGDWRTARDKQHAPDVSALSPGYNSRPGYGFKPEQRTPVMVTFNGPQFRNECYVDEHKDTRCLYDHQGWYTDAYCSATLRAFVYDLPHGRFGCGYADSDTGERVYYLRVFDNVRDAASFADSEAQHYAEQEKEYNERWHAAREIVDEIEEEKPNMRRLYALRNHPELGQDCRDELSLAIEVTRNLRDKLATEYKDVEF